MTSSPVRIPEAIAEQDASGRIPGRVGSGLAVLLGMLALAQFLAWLPGYLCRPYWADHDVYATMAQGWRRGELPYRDLKSNQFPGSLYLFALLDRVGGVDHPAVFYAVDAVAVLGFGLALSGWSRRRFGTILPGLIGALTFAGYEFSLEHLDTGQHDWQAALLGVLGLMALEVLPGARGRIGSAVLLALALVLRPQAVVLLPAYALALDEQARPDGGEPVSRTFRAALAWGIAAIVVVALAFLPLVLTGVWNDFLLGLSHVRYGAGYNREGLLSPTRVRYLLDQVTDLSVPVLPVAVGVLGARSGRPLRRLSWTWLAAYAGIALYKPISPHNFSYLDVPLMVVRAALVAVLAGLIVQARDLPGRVRLVALLLTLCLGAQLRPRFSSPSGIRDAVQALWHGTPTSTPPRGLKYFATAAENAAPVRLEITYPWRDYQALIAFLRDHTDRSLPIANLLPHEPALASVTRHPSLFPAESVAWLRVRREDEGAFLRDLEEAPEGLVVWSPELDRLHDGQALYTRDSLWPALKAVVRRDYEPWRRFGPFELWTRRKPVTP